MKDLIVGFEFEGTRYGALIEFFDAGGGVFVAATKTLRSFSSPDPITDMREITRVVQGSGHYIIPLVQAHLNKEYQP